MLQCRDCNIDLTADNAVKTKKTKRGFDTICKTCNAKRAAAWYASNKDRAAAGRAIYYRAHKDKFKAQAEKRKADPVRHGALLAQKREYRVLNAERIKVTLRDWYCRNGAAYYQANRDKLREASLRNYYANERGPKAAARHREWKRTNPIRWRELQTVANNARRARLAQVASYFTADEWLDILEVFGHACAYCLKSGLKLEQEHVIPIARGGSHTADNIVPACRACNARKKDRGPLSILYRLTAI